MKNWKINLILGCCLVPTLLWAQVTQSQSQRASGAGTPPNWGALGLATPTGAGAWPLAVSYGPDQLAVFWDMGENMYVRRWQGGVWSNWESMGWTLGNDRAILKVVSWGPGRMDAFTTVEGHLYHSYWQGGAWSPWDHRGGGNLEGYFDVVSWAPNRLDIFASTETGGLKHMWWDNGWGTWEELRGQNGLRDFRNVKVVSWAPGRLDIFVALEDYSLDHLWYENGWGDWESLGGGVEHDFAVVCKEPGKIDIFLSGLDYKIYRKFWNGQMWSKWMPIPVDMKPKTALVAISRGRGKIDLFYTQPNASVALFQWDSNDESTNYVELGGFSYGGLAAASWGPNRLDVIVIGGDKQFYHMPWDGYNWGY